MRTTSRFARRLAWWLLPLAVLLAAPCFASRIAPPRLVVSAPVESPIVLQKLAISAEIAGSVAVTTVEMVFFNPNHRTLEGELQFPLLDGQQIVGFALDVDGKLRDAVPVEKSRGQQVFEDITRRGVDPGLLSATQGNNFKLRVYPLFAQRTRTVQIRYSEPLVSRGAGAAYRLPLEYGGTVGEFSLALKVRGATARPALAGAAAHAMAFAAVEDGYQLTVRHRDHAPRGVLEVAVGLPAGARTLTQQHDGRKYFYTELHVSTGKLARAVPATVGIIWDSSGSGAARNHARELALLDAYFARMGNGEVRLTRIRDAAEPVERYTIANGDWRELRRALEATVYDGATNLGSFAPEAAVGEYLLFSDGLNNFGEGSLAETRVPLYAISSAVQAHPAWLKHLAHRSGGRYLDLTAETPKAAAGKLLNAFERVVSLSSDGAADLMAISPYPASGKLAITGVLTEPSAMVRIALALPGRAPRVIAVPVGKGASDSALAASFWARARVAELDADYAVNRAAILRVGRSFGIVTRETSLIVLEFIEDYVRFDIAPPRELMAEYERARRGMGVASAPDRQQKIERIVALLKEKENWWKCEFPKGRLPAPVEERYHLRSDDRAVGIRGTEGDVARSLMAPPASSAPVPMAVPKPAPKAALEMRQAMPLREWTEAQVSQGAGRIAAPSRPFDAAQDRRFDFARDKAWNPDASYAARLRDAEPAEAYRVYLDERLAHATTPAFFVDAADILAAKGQQQLALRVLSNLAEIDLENRHILRTLGHRLMQAGEPRLALAVFKRVLELSPEEPQSFRDVGLAYAAAGERQRAVDSLYEVVVRPWHNRFPQIELVALADLNAIVGSRKGRLDLSRIDPRLLRNLPLDLRIVLAWDTDNTDVNLLVSDPNGQQSHPGGALSYQGGRTSANFFGGYGPEEYSLRTAKPGTYRVVAQFASNRQQVAGAGPTHAHLRVYTKFGTPEQSERAYSVRLTRPGEAPVIVEIEVPGKADED
jgi:Ca-activated chloride channel homolog